MANNNALFNAAFEGALNGLASRWLTNINASSYDAQRDLCVEFATAFDDRIATIVGGATQPQADLAESICGAFWRGRILTATADVDGAADALVAVWNSAQGQLLPVSGGGSNVGAATNTGVAIADDGVAVEVFSFASTGEAIAIVALNIDPDDPADTPAGNVSIIDPDIGISTLLWGPIVAGESLYFAFSTPGTGDGDWSVQAVVDSGTGPCTINKASLVMISV